MNHRTIHLKLYNYVVMYLKSNRNYTRLLTFFNKYKRNIQTLLIFFLTKKF